MELKKEYTINFGLFKKDMKTELNKDLTLNEITSKLNEIGIEGFSTDFSTGSWKGKLEPNLNISFINTFGVTETQIKDVLGDLRDSLDQDSILLRSKDVEYDFI